MLGVGREGGSRIFFSAANLTVSEHYLTLRSKDLLSLTFKGLPRMVFRIFSLERELTDRQFFYLIYSVGTVTTAMTIVSWPLLIGCRVGHVTFWAVVSSIGVTLTRTSNLERYVIIGNRRPIAGGRRKLCVARRTYRQIANRIFVSCTPVFCCTNMTLEAKYSSYIYPPSLSLSAESLERWRRLETLLRLSSGYYQAAVVSLIVDPFRVE